MLKFISGRKALEIPLSYGVDFPVIHLHGISTGKLSSLRLMPVADFKAVIKGLQAN